MKKVYLLLAGTALFASSGFSQKLISLPSVQNARHMAAPMKSSNHFTAKADGDAIYTNTFNNAADWNIVDNSVPLCSPYSWKLGTAAPTGSFSTSMGAITSTTAANGFALFDSDKVYSAEGQQNASLELAVGIDFTTKPNVTMEVQSYHRKFHDSIFIEFSVNGGAWGNAIQLDEDLAVGSSSDNPTLYSMNVSAIVGGQANVKVRFRYIGEWDYAWMVDDLKFSETFQHDLELTTAAMVTNGLDYYAVPTSQVDFPGATFGGDITNQGYGAQANAALSVKVNANAPVLSATTSLASLATDSLSIETFIPLAAGTNTITVSADLGANTDGSISNNSKVFTVMNGGNVYTRSNGQIENLTNYVDQNLGMRVGNIMDIYNDMIVAGVRARIDNKPENVGQELAMEIWKFNTTTSDYEVFSSNTVEIAQADLGNYVYIPALAGENELFEGETVIVYVKHSATEDFVRIGLSQPVLPQTTLMFFGEETEGFYLNNAAMVDLVEGYLGVNELTNDNQVSVYPNPANDEAKVSFKLVNDAKVNITVTDLTGKVVYTSNTMNNVAGANSVTINTSTFSNGIYMVNFEANNEVYSQKLVIRK